MPWSVGAIRKTFGRRLRVDDLLAALEDDADRHAGRSGDAPGRVDAGAFVDDRDRVPSHGAADVRDRTSGGERVVRGPDLQRVDRPVDADAVGVDLARRQPGAVLDRAAEVRRARERRVDDDDERLALRRAAAAGSEQDRSGEQQREQERRASCAGHSREPADRGRPSAPARRPRPPPACRRRSRGPHRARRPDRRATGRPRGCARRRSGRGPSSLRLRRRSATRTDSAADAPAVGSSSSKTGAPVA